MGDIKLFRLHGDHVTELAGQSFEVEKSLQHLIERHLDALLGVKFLATEYTTGKSHGGRIDTLGIDENGYPVIIEYKRSLNENVINQGLFYLNWLLDHRGEFENLVWRTYGRDVADQIEWSNPRLLCLASDFTKYDEHAVQQINRTIELIRYRRYGDSLLLLELVNAVSSEVTTATSSSSTSGSRSASKTVTDYLAQASPDLRDLYFNLEAFATALGDDVQKKVLKNYFAFKRIKNFACVEVHPQSGNLLVYLKVDPDSIELQPGYTRDVRNIGHFGTGDLEVRVTSREQLERAKPLIAASYEAS